jgi:hypothetical protein
VSGGRAVVVALALVMACHQARPEAQLSADSCRPPTGTLPRTATADGLAGDYRLHITATSGSRSGRWVEGSLRLRPLSDSLARSVVVLGVRDTTTSHPLAGTADLDPAALGAVRTGNLADETDEAPGVLVIERHPVQPDAGAEIMLRMGSDANRRGVVRYDGGFFALTVRSIGPAGFAGTWSSGGAGNSAEGYFCAERVDAERVEKNG